jgi:hypothetical protein
MAAPAKGHNPARSHAPETQKQAHRPPYLLAERASVRGRACLRRLGGDREALCEPDSKWGTKDEVIAEALFAARVTALQERRRGRVGAEGGKRHTTYIMARAGVPLEGD